MGGLIAGGGFDFQTRYAACGIPLWLLEATFQQLLYEGAGDIDIRYQEEEKSSRTFMQVKDHDVQPAEFKEVIKHFIASRYRTSQIPINASRSSACPYLQPSGPWRMGLPAYVA